MKWTPTERIDSEEPAWDESALASPHDEKTKAARVNRMFDAIAESYDLNNRVHSLWRDQAWRRKAVGLAGVREGVDRVVDVACGTGDLTFAFAAAGPAEVVGIDFVPRMIEIAKRKKEWHLGGGWLRVEPDFRVGDATALDGIESEYADIVSIAFGIRNVDEPMKALREFRRILRSGGRLMVLEFGLPRSRMLRAFYHFYFNQVMPRTATLLSRDRSGAYRYLPRSVQTFIGRDAMVEMMKEAGFGEVSIHPMTFGICIGYLGRVGV